MMKFLLSLALLALALPSVRAAEVLACPAWEITVVDEALRPLAGCAVAQEWGCTFKSGYVGATANAVTDAQGQVSFPARLVSSPPPASRWKRILRALDGKEDPQPGATILISKPGHRYEWIWRRDPGVIAGRDGLRLRLVLKAEKPG
jgi:hypothetical protein